MVGVHGWISLFENNNTSSFVLKMTYRNLFDIVVAVRTIPWYEGLQVVFKTTFVPAGFDAKKILKILTDRYSTISGNVFDVTTYGYKITVKCKKRVYSPGDHVSIAPACAIISPKQRQVDNNVFPGKIPFLLFRFNDACGVREFLHTRHMIELFLPGTQVETMWHGKKGNWKLVVGFRELKQFVSLQ